MALIYLVNLLGRSWLDLSQSSAYDNRQYQVPSGFISASSGKNLVILQGQSSGLYSIATVMEVCVLK
jgi:hypothetical protein